MTQKTLEQHILVFAESALSFTTNDVLTSLERKYSRQLISKELKRLVDNKRLFRTGSTRGARYSLPHKAHLLFPSFQKKYVRKGKDEITIFEEFQQKLPQIDALPVAARRMLVYTFTEIVNNAINHSQGRNVSVLVSIQEQDVVVRVIDNGIGIFRNIMQKFGFPSEMHAMQELVKGKLTTDPENHTGQGVFFSSKAADVFTIESYGYVLEVNNRKPDVAFFPATHPGKQIRGTHVQFRINKNTSVQLKDVFLQYQTQGVGGPFDTTQIQVKLYALGTEFVSRSEAKRILERLESFSRIILDFDKVEGVGQGFVDQVFRIFPRQHSNIAVESVNANPVVQFMIDRAIADARQMSLDSQISKKVS